eukprot:403358020
MAIGLGTICPDPDELHFSPLNKKPVIETVFQVIPTKGFEESCDWESFQTIVDFFKNDHRNGTMDCSVKGEKLIKCKRYSLINDQQLTLSWNLTFQMTKISPNGTYKGITNNLSSGDPMCIMEASSESNQFGVPDLQNFCNLYDPITNRLVIKEEYTTIERTQCIRSLFIDHKDNDRNCTCIQNNQTPECQNHKNITSKILISDDHQLKSNQIYNFEENEIPYQNLDKSFLQK